MTGRLLDTCQRDKVRENYLAPEDHAVGVVLAGPVTPGSTCGWSFNDGTSRRKRCPRRAMKR